MTLSIQTTSYIKVFIVLNKNKQIKKKYFHKR